MAQALVTPALVLWTTVIYDSSCFPIGIFSSIVDSSMLLLVTIDFCLLETSRFISVMFTVSAVVYF